MVGGRVEREEEGGLRESEIVWGGRKRYGC